MSAVNDLLCSLSQNGPDYKIYDKNRNAIDIQNRCRGKIVAFYFSASWCPPCKTFTPVLSRFYNKYHTSKNFEVIFVTSDSDPQKALQYFSLMPFWRLSFQDVEGSRNLKSHFGVQSIPRLVLVKADTGHVLNTNAVPKLMSEDREGFQFPWPQFRQQSMPESISNSHRNRNGECRLNGDMDNTANMRTR